MPVLEPLAAQAFAEFRTDRCWELATPRVRDVLVRGRPGTHTPPRPLTDPLLARENVQRHARERADCMVVISNFDERLRM